MQQVEFEQLQQEALINQPVNQIIDSLTNGVSRTGSGSAAALLGILSTRTILSVCRSSLDNPECLAHRNEFEHIIRTLEVDIEPRLKKLFELDAQDFERVAELHALSRRAIDASDKQLENKFKRESRNLLEVATDYTFEIAQLCLRLIAFGITAFDCGDKSARANAGVGISTAVSGVMSAIFIINLNLKSLKNRKYAKNNIKKCQDLQQILEGEQRKAFTRVTSLNLESVEAIQLDLIGKQSV